MLLDKTALGKIWEKLIVEGEKQFPTLKFTKPKDLHITFNYIGAAWKVDNLEKIRLSTDFSQSVTPATIASKFKFSWTGDKNQVAALEIMNFPTTWSSEVVKGNHLLNTAGLKKVDKWDDDFTAHVSLVQPKIWREEPNTEERAELERFKKWVEQKIDLEGLKINLNIKDSIFLMLAGATHEDTTKEYVTIDEFLQRNCPQIVSKKIAPDKQRNRTISNTKK